MTRTAIAEEYAREADATANTDGPAAQQAADALTSIAWSLLVITDHLGDLAAWAVQRTEP